MTMLMDRLTVVLVLAMLVRARFVMAERLPCSSAGHAREN